MQMDYLSECARSSINAVNRFLGQRSGTSISAPLTVGTNQGYIVIASGAASASTVTFPQSSLWPGREITVVNLTGNNQTISSYNGTALEFRQTSAAATATVTLENASSTSTGRRTYKSVNSQWVLVSI